MNIRSIDREIDNQSITVHILPALKDNYIYLIQWEGEALVIDPGVHEPVLSFLDKQNVELKAILNTHHHKDHIGGNAVIKEKTGCSVIGPSDMHIADLDQVVSDGEEIIMGPLLIQVMMTMGHSLDHLCYYLPDYKMIFTGDTLFSGGCGKVFEGTPKQLFHSLQKIARLPQDTLIFCGHEYTLANLAFAKSIETDNAEIDARIDLVEKEGFGVPSTLEMELKTNPFLRVNSKAIRERLKMEKATDEEVFCKLIEEKAAFASS